LYNIHQILVQIGEEKMRKETRSLVSLFLTFSFIFFATAAHAESWPHIMKLIFQKYSKYTKNIKDMKIKFIGYTPDGVKQTVTTSYVKGNKVRTVLKYKLLGDMKIIVISDGKHTWTFSPFNKDKEQVQYQSGNQTFWWEILPEEGKILGKEKIKGIKCLVVAFKLTKNNQLEKLWLNPHTLLPVKTLANISGQEVEHIYSKYKKFNGIDFAQETKTYIQGHYVGYAKLKYIKTNLGLSDDIFDPKKVKVKTIDILDLFSQ
jgi:outer membrane lipoprotein-sorting protein